MPASGSFSVPGPGPPAGIARTAAGGEPSPPAQAPWPVRARLPRRGDVARSVLREAWGVALTVLLGFWAGIACSQPPAAAPEPRLSLGPCAVEGWPAAECGYFEVAENRSQPHGRRVQLYFEILRAADGAQGKKEPIFFFSGGPGEAATESSIFVRQTFGGEDVGRDLVLVDARGTGRSNGMDCLHSPRVGEEWSAEGVFEAWILAPEPMRICRQRFEKESDLRQYTTSIIADDMNELRQALGYEEINIYGGSYGSRLAYEYLRRHPESVRTAAMVGFAPSFGNLISSLPQDVEEVLDRVLEACETDAGCHEAFPDVREEVLSVLSRLEAGAVRVEVHNPATGRPETVALDYDHAATGLRYLLYSAQLQALLPSVFHEAHRGNYEPIAKVVLVTSLGIAEALYEGMWASVKCTEEIAFTDHEAAVRLAEGTVMGRGRLDAEWEICEGWPRGEVPPDFHEPLHSDLPILLITGDLDVASPPRLGERAIRTLPNGIFLRLANRSHLGSYLEPCTQEILRRFVESGTKEGLDVSCAGRLERVPFAREFPGLDNFFG